MLDIKFVRTNPDIVKQNIKNKIKKLKNKKNHQLLRNPNKSKPSLIIKSIYNLKNYIIYDNTHREIEILY